MVVCFVGWFDVWLVGEGGFGVVEVVDVDLLVGVQYECCEIVVVYG